MNVPVIPKNSTIPCQYEDTFVTREPNQSEWICQVTEGDDPDPEYVVKLLERPLRLPPGLPKGAPMKVTMSYDVDGVVHVAVTDVTNGTSLGEIELERPLNLGRSDVERMQAAMKRLEIQ